MMNFINTEHADDLDFIRYLLKGTDFAVCSVFEKLFGGSSSFAYAADGVVLRFPKTKIAWKSMQREAIILERISPALNEALCGKIQSVTLIEGDYPFSFLQRLAGKICDNRPEKEYAISYQHLTSAQQLDLARQIATFFDCMHRIDYHTLNIPPLSENPEKWDKTNEIDFDAEHVRECLTEVSSGKINLDDYFVQKPNFESALCHNDLSGSNLLITPEKDDILGGIIDFANTVVVPKYYDFFPLYKINGKLARDTLREYNKRTTAPIEQKQIDYLALTYIGYGFYKTKNMQHPYFQKLLRLFDEKKS